MKGGETNVGNQLSLQVINNPYKEKSYGLQILG